ncbi:hypothetical protein CY34DRAFT_750825 [Suillus luteus UH-Slu-Lm8-n1]|uniref:Uncharacterized protein n=1 Tax=Suillus luteus UH-Slu-Lm8-n1 TaxID=930992 RepID=A0A0C9ZYN9_9AGAM|nr:hypothetical protein CY34DRAFT_750825 [Suillus luteus UH-Slu-Lm8-n1]
MTAFFKPVVENWYPSHPLPNDVLLPHPPDDSDTIPSDTKSTVVTTDFYDRSPISRRFAIIGLALSSIISFCCIITGVVILTIRGVSGVIPLMKLGNSELQTYLQFEMLSLILNALVTICTESTGFVHSISLRSALASEGRLRFNTNLRLLTAARGWRNPNGVLLNGIMVLLLISSYSSSSLVISYNYSSSQSTASAAIAGLPLFFLGVALLLQVVIALLGMRGAEILTWSSSPFDVTAALLHNNKLTRFSSRCMCCITDRGVDACPAKPSNTQPSAWHAHPSIRKVVISLWGVVIACAGWAGMVTYFKNENPVWTFLPWEASIVYRIPGVNPLDVNLQVWVLLFINIAVVQGPLTLGLHCSELIANVIRDERQWRRATEKKGLKTTTNPLIPIFAHPICLILFVMKPFLHWMFGLATTVADGAEDGKLSGGLAVLMFEAQIWNLCVALFIFSCFFTFIVLRRPRGPQPAAYGHLQTLANLIDSPLSPVMWWGHKKDGLVCHAGTSDHELQAIKMDCVYAGSGAVSST